MEYVAQLKRLLEALGAHGVEYVLIGGAALNLHGLVRATEDIDLLIAPYHDNVDRLRRALRDVWDDPCIDDISGDDLCGDYPAVRYGPPSGSLYLDILTRLGERMSYDDLRWEVVDIDGVSARVATPRMLYEMKRDTVRPIDKADAAALRDAFDFGED